MIIMIYKKTFLAATLKKVFTQLIDFLLMINNDNDFDEYNEFECIFIF